MRRQKNQARLCLRFYQESHLILRLEPQPLPRSFAEALVI